ncbi:endonuclease/exonuclease/phosphatase family protein [Saccharopolyspora gloriosae]|uniref:endonuclease/exonuclease/phosphatase family protein n=1 Tax=Saccharopolyspora gloriosae TaxID=455344 RepID=UPI001FB634C6|nr:endonuclease/exonuclease/phosphatase family protein [Saccharopolyspora gloriosae]
MTDTRLSRSHLPRSHQKNRRARTGALAGAGALLACTGFAVPAFADTTAEPFDVLQLNLCHSGVADCYTGDDTAVRSGIATVRQRTPDVVTLNEICAHDITTMTKETGYHAEFAAAGHRDGGPYQCADDRGDYGVAILTHPDLGAPSGDVTERTYTAQDGGTEQRVMLCAPFSAISACTTHLSADAPEIAGEQCRELMGAATGAGRPTVIGGDFNLSHGGTPDVQNCVPDGWFRKGDGSVQHVFANGDFGFERTENLPIEGTDHPGLLVELSH